MGERVNEAPVLWQPSAQAISGTRVDGFRRLVNERHHLDLADHEALWQWSVTEPAAFWAEVWDFCGVVGETGKGPVLEDAALMPGARWFPAARLNYAENLLQGDDEAEALVFRGEDGRSVHLTWADLRRRTAAVAAALAADGVGPGDRVAGFMPNLPETVIAMLATSSLGAVWSSCSPDFGLQGVRDRFSQIEPKVLFAADGYLYGGKAHDSLATVARLRDDLPQLARCVIVPFLGDRELPAAAVAWDDYTVPKPPAVPVYHRAGFDHPLFIMFSSGTTGLPKCMVHGAGGTLLQHLKEHQLHGDLGPGDRLFYFTTCGWMMWNWLVSGLASRATVLLFDGHPLEPRRRLWDFVADEGVTTFGTSARYLGVCAKEGLEPGRDHDLSRLDSILSTGSPLAPDTFDWVYRAVKQDLRLSSISGGTDIISCFALGSPVLPVRRGELQCRGLGMDVAVWNDAGQPVIGAKGELVCTTPFPSMPTGFWNDPGGVRYRRAYFERFPGVWHHGDYAELTPSGGVVIHGRSDTVLNPGGVRIGTGEIYRVVDREPDVVECLVVGQRYRGDVRVVLFVVLQPDQLLDRELEDRLRHRIRTEATPRHVPALIFQVPDLPRTISGKTVETAVARILHGEPVENTDALANPQALESFRRLAAGLAR
ncbi:acetoacetate--CoA ligase [bacterium]|nr:MAG: acetoacetate--CoA ligase [bacterium]